MSQFKTTSIIFKNVTLGKNTKIEDFCLIGVVPKSSSATGLSTIIGKNSLIRSHTVIYAGNIIGENFSTGHGVLIREKNKIGKNVSIGSHTVIEHHVVIGDNVRIHSSAFIPEFTVIEENVWVGPSVVLTNAKYPASKYAKKHLAGPKIKKGAKIGASVVILPGITIGRDVLVGAGSVVVEDVPQGKVVVGNPAKIINRIDKLFFGSGKKAY